MSKIKSLSPLRFFSCLFFSISLQLVPGLGDNSSSNGNKDATKKSSNWLEILLILFGLLAAVAFSVFLYKLWQRKKRDEQHSRLLKLFEQDDDLELELGIRD
ncbi:hypothetical protein ACJIZ3_019140 [Penstemon smallii]|uniref:Transmembrane protein n=1 Tax=Penstemon smallii TaxID=265156 RepID=A0ABD3T1K9_9LAMI